MSRKSLFRLDGKNSQNKWLVSPEQGVKFDYFLLFANMGMLIATQSTLFIMFTVFMSIRMHARFLNASASGQKTKFPIKEFKLKRKGTGTLLLSLLGASIVSYATNLTNAIFTPSALFTEGATVVNSILPSATIVFDAIPQGILAPFIIFILAAQEEQIWRGTVPYLFSEEVRDIGLIIAIFGFSVFHLATYTNNIFSANANFALAAIVGFILQQVVEEADSTAHSTIIHTILNLNEDTLNLVRTLLG